MVGPEVQQPSNCVEWVRRCFWPLVYGFGLKSASWWAKWQIAFSAKQVLVMEIGSELLLEPRTTWAHAQLKGSGWKNKELLLGRTRVKVPWEQHGTLPLKGMEMVTDGVVSVVCRGLEGPQIKGFIWSISDSGSGLLIMRQKRAKSGHVQMDDLVPKDTNVYVIAGPGDYLSIRDQWVT